MSIVLKCPKGSFKVWPRVRVRVRAAASVLMLGLDVDPWRSRSRARFVGSGPSPPLPWPRPRKRCPSVRGSALSRIVCSVCLCTVRPHLPGQVGRKGPFGPGSGGKVFS
jgi:hypothetical protein